MKITAQRIVIGALLLIACPSSLLAQLATACCPTIRSRTGIDCWHGFNAATTVVSAHDRIGLGASPSTDRHRISAGREPAPEEATAWGAHSVHRCRASTSG